MDKKSAANKLKERGISISSGGIRSVWKRHNLKTFEKRLKALEAKVAQGGIILTEGQRIALEKAKEQKEAQDEIEAQHSGYLGGQDTYYVGYIEGIGKSISKPSLMLIRGLHLSNCMWKKQLLRLQTFLMTELFRFLKNIKFHYYGF